MIVSSGSMAYLIIAIMLLLFILRSSVWHPVKTPGSASMQQEGTELRRQLMFISGYGKGRMLQGFSTDTHQRCRKGADGQGQARVSTWHRSRVSPRVHT